MKAGRQLIPRLRAQRLGVWEILRESPRWGLRASADAALGLVLAADVAPDKAFGAFLFNFSPVARLSLAARAVLVALQHPGCLGSSSAPRSRNGSSRLCSERPAASASEA